MNSRVFSKSISINIDLTEHVFNIHATLLQNYIRACDKPQRLSKDVDVATNF